MASALTSLAGSPAERVRQAAESLEDATRSARAEFGRSLDLMVFPEFALLRPEGNSAGERAVALTDPAVDRLREHVRTHQTWLVMPMILRESSPDAQERLSNAAVLFDRDGGIAGVFRKVHAVLDPDGRYEGGVTPGAGFPVFECDFGRLGLLICWDMAYPQSWAALAQGGAELVALPSASPQTLRPSAAALHHGYYVLTSTPRDNASLFNPIGQTVAQITAPGVLVHEIDLAYAVVHWSATLQEGRALTERFGDRVGHTYSPREDTGIFWSNDPEVSIGEMLRALGLREMRHNIERNRQPISRAD